MIPASKALVFTTSMRLGKRVPRVQILPVRLIRPSTPAPLLCLSKNVFQIRWLHNLRGLTPRYQRNATQVMLPRPPSFRTPARMIMCIVVAPQAITALPPNRPPLPSELHHLSRQKMMAQSLCNPGHLKHHGSSKMVLQSMRGLRTLSEQGAQGGLQCQACQPKTSQLPFLDT